MKQKRGERIEIKKDSVGKDGRKIPLGESPRFPEREIEVEEKVKKPFFLIFHADRRRTPFDQITRSDFPIHQKSNPFFQQLANKLIVVPYHFLS